MNLPWYGDSEARATLLKWSCGSKKSDDWRLSVISPLEYYARRSSKLHIDFAAHAAIAEGTIRTPPQFSPRCFVMKGY
jgi:hypothetical protein